MITEEEKQLIERWRISVDNFIVNDIRKCLDNDIIEVGLIILTLSAIESISGYFAGSRADKSTFIKFLSSEYFPSQYGPVARKLYPLRNSLFHDYASDGNTFVLFRTRNQGYKHLQEQRTNYGTAIALNRETLATDFLQAWGQFATAAIDKEEISIKVLDRIRDTNRGFLIVSAIAIQTPYSISDSPDPHINSATYSSNPASYSGGTISNNANTDNKTTNR